MHSRPGLPSLHSRDLVNWKFVADASDRLDLGPAYRLEDGKRIHGQGIWAPSFRYHGGTFYIFSNVNGQTAQVSSTTTAKCCRLGLPRDRARRETGDLQDQRECDE
jgi:xylan 1,4-beta-xylosidase